MNTKTSKSGNLKFAQNTLQLHVQSVIDGKLMFENVFQAVSRMILGDSRKIKKVIVNGRSTYDFSVFREGKKHIIGMYDEINSFVSFVKDAAEGGSSSEMAFVLIGEPGNGKTYFVDFFSKLYREFIALPENNRYTFRFINLDKVGKYGKIQKIESQTYEDPMILAMNLSENKTFNTDFLISLGAKPKQIDQFYRNYRSLGACTYYIWNQILDFCNGDVNKALTEFVEVVKVPVSESRGHTYRKICSQG
jgi:serine protein kinase